jgi:hypothetical protein
MLCRRFFVLVHFRAYITCIALDMDELLRLVVFYSVPLRAIVN